MSRPDSKKYKKIEDLDQEAVLSLLERWDCHEFVDFAREKNLDGRKLLDVSEGIVKLWRPKANVKAFITFINDLKQNPHKYINKPESSEDFEIIEFRDCSSTTKVDIESQYQTIPMRKKEENTSTMSSTVDEIIRRLVPAKSFLYRHQQKADGVPSYLPMDAGTPKKRRLFSLSSHEYPFFDIKSRFSRQDSSNDRGYYLMKRNSRYCMYRTYKKIDNNKPRHKSISTADELTEKYPEDHFYEDLCYNEVEKASENPERLSESRLPSVKPCITKIQELFHSFKVPFFKKHEMLQDKKEDVIEKVEKDTVKETNYYENSDSAANMYDSVHVNVQGASHNEDTKQPKLPVEEYLEPVQVNKDYCDIRYKQKDDSLLGYILSIFENRFGIRRETNDDCKSEDSETDSHKADNSPGDDGGRKWPDDKKFGRTNMADRPLPVPVESEPYYMNVDRTEAQNLLKGHPDGTFILRPSSLPDHAYTLSIACGSGVHNVGVRRRADGRLALGFARRAEHSFGSVTSLVRHHRRRRLLLVAAGQVIGATTLGESPSYYQTPNSLPVEG